MKVLYYLLFALLASQTSQLSGSDFCTEVRPTRAEDCHKAGLSSEGFTFFKCCYVNAKVNAQNKERYGQACFPATKAMFNKFSTLWDIAQDSAKELNVNILTLDVNCDSKYLVVSILSILLFLL